jgi:short-subunit dehydrogenase
MKLDGARVLLTGASSGIGASLAPMLAERGATVGLIARRRDRLAQVNARVSEHSPDSRMWVCDLADPDDAVAAALTAQDELGAVDVIINNAAIPKRRDALALTPEELDETMRVNFTSPVRMIMALLPGMVDRGIGSIVNVSSMGGRVGIVGETAYCASKFALCGYTESLAVDLWDSPIDVRLIIPGPIDTEIWSRPDNDAPHYDGPFEPPSIVAEGIIAAIEGDEFEHYLPDLKAVVEFKTSDIDTFLEGSAGLKGSDGS